MGVLTSIMKRSSFFSKRDLARKHIEWVIKTINQDLLYFQERSGKCQGVDNDEDN